jgi:hypothetical protein
MSIPGFSAEAAVRDGRRYRGKTTRDRPVDQIVPAAPRWSYSCIATTDGGQWCCIYGPARPICWKVPPPVIIWV